MALATFAACDALAGDGDGGGALRPSVAFPALALFNVLRLPMATLPSEGLPVTANVDSNPRLRVFDCFSWSCAAADGDPAQWAPAP